MISDEIYRDGKVEFTPDFKSVEPFPDEGLDKALSLVINSNYIKQMLSQKNVLGIIHILSHIKEAVDAEKEITKHKK